MKCPFCAEVIQDEAKKCRFCGEIITDAAKRGYPAFYTKSGYTGLTPDSLDADYGEHLFPDKGFLNFGCEYAVPRLIQHVSYGDDDYDYVVENLREISAYLDAVGKRLDHPGTSTEERSVLEVLARYLITCRDVINAELRAYDYQPILERFQDLKAKAASFDPSIRGAWTPLLDQAISACELRIAKSSPAPAQPPPIQGVPPSVPIPPPAAASQQSSQRSGCGVLALAAVLIPVFVVFLLVQ